jgi:hypothetical protein
MLVYLLDRAQERREREFFNCFLSVGAGRATQPPRQARNHAHVHGDVHGRPEQGTDAPKNTISKRPALLYRYKGHNRATLFTGGFSLYYK